MTTPEPPSSRPADTPDDSVPERTEAPAHEHREEYSEVDPETVVDDAIDYFSDEPGAADSPAADADAPPPG
jgi:hypothetical protein